MRPFPPRHGLLMLAIAGSLVAGCAPTVRVHGYVPPPVEISTIRPGVDTFATVEEKLGLPSSSGLLRDSEWYYVQSVFESYLYRAPRVMDRTVLAVTFDNNGVVRGVTTYGLEDGRIIDLTNRTTETGGRELGVLEQLFGNLLNVDASQFEQ